MAKAASATLQGDLLSVEPYRDASGRRTPGRTFLLEVKDAASSSMLLASLSMLDRLLVGAVALLTIYANYILNTAPWGMGQMRSAPAF